MNRALPLFTLLLLLAATPALAARGGPDAGGWMWADSDEPGVDTSLESVTGWTSITTDWPDEAVFPVDLSFPVTLYGTTSSRVWLSSNGWLSLTDPGPNAAPANTALPDPGSPRAMLAYFWDDLIGGFAQHGPTANGHAILIRHNVRATGSLFQAFVFFHRNGSIKIAYSIDPELPSATIGIQDGTGTIATQLAYNGTVVPGIDIRSNYAILFYPRAAPDCAGALPLACPASVAGTTLGASADISRYGCSALDHTGRERVYEVSLSGLTALDATLSGMGLRDQDLFLLRAECDGTLGCLAGGADTITEPMLAAGTYYLVVDGRTLGDDGAFNLAVTCGAVSAPLPCGSTVSDSAAGPSGIDGYGCRTGTYTGPEKIYDFTTLTTQTITARLTPAAPFDLILADQTTMTPGTSPCIRGHDSEVGALNLPPGSYALIVDGPLGSSGAFDLDLDCQDQVPAVPIFCNSVGVPGSSVRSSMINLYPGCGGGAYPMGEEYYRFQPTQRVIATATTTRGADYDIFLFRESEAPDGCAARGDASLSVANLVPDDYLFVLDAKTVEGPTDLSLQCTPMTPTPVSCNTAVTGVTAATGNLDGYTCLGRPMAGGEAYFVLDNPADQWLGVAVTESNPGVDLAVTMFDGPFDTTAPACVAGGDRVARWPGATAGDYLIVVDGPAGTGGQPFSLTVACGSSAFAVDCTAAPDLPCNTLVSGDTATGTSTAALYGKVDDLFTGPELIYRFSVPGPGPQTASFLLRNLSDPMVDLIVTSACDPGTAIAWGDDSLIIPRLDPGDYFLIIDGRSGHSGSFDLVRFCGTGANLDPPRLDTTLEPGECYTEHKHLYFAPTVPAADVMFSFDLSGSMGQELDQVKRNATAIYTALDTLIDSLQFGLASFVEYDQPYTDTVCGWSHVPSAPTPYPFRLHQPLTDDITQVNTVLSTINLVGGAFETYTRSFWEAVHNPDIGWRDCSHRLWLSFGDEPPMDCAYDACIGGATVHGRDPGPNLITGDADDILLLPTVDEMAANDITLIPVDSSEDQHLIDTWDCLAQRTGGRAFVTDQNGNIPDGTDIVEGLVEVIIEAIRHCPDLRLVGTGPLASWVTVDPPVLNDVSTPYYGEFDITFCVPPDTPPGSYSAPLEARCFGGGACIVELLGSQEVHIEVPVPCPVDPVATASAPTICEGDTATLDGSDSTPCDSAGLQYRWLDGAAEVCGWSTDPTCDVAPAATTTYTLEVACVDATECTATTGVTVEVVPFPSPVLAPLAPICAGDAVDLSAAASDPRGCSVPLEYRFRDGATVIRDWDPSPIHGPLTPGASTTFSVDVRCTAAPACAATTDQPLTVVPPPLAEAGPGADVCEDQPVTLDAAGSTDRGCPGGLEYEWRQGATVVRPWSSVPAWGPPTATAGTTTYTVHVRCASPPGCEDADVVEVAVRACPLAVHYEGYQAAWDLGADPVPVIEVTWRTAFEEGTRAFVVERADTADGSFTELGRARATGSGSSYGFRDPSAAVGSRPWYRVVELTLDGRGDATPPFQTLAPGSPVPPPARGGRSRGRSQIRD